MNDQSAEPGHNNAVAQQPWYAAFPAALSDARNITAAETLDLLKSGDTRDRRFVMIDLRRVDYEGGTIRGSINLPAQSLYPTIPSLYAIFSAAKVRSVIWYCGSSRGRGNRAAAWFGDHIQEQNDTQMESLVLAGGMKAWVACGDEYIRYVQGYDESKWIQ